MSENLFEAMVKRRLLEDNKDWFCVICGEKGSGKSYSALFLASRIDPSFKVDNVVFTPEEFMKRLNSPDIKQGSVIVFDEGGVSLGSREWFTKVNRILNKVLQTVRHLNIGVIFTVPIVTFMDSQAQKLFHTQVIMKSRGNRYVAFFYNVHADVRTGKVYTVRFRNQNGAILGGSLMAPPSKELAGCYEIKADAFKRKLHGRKAIKALRDAGKPEEKKPELDLNEIANQILLGLPSFQTKWGNRLFIDHRKISNHFAVGVKLAERIRVIVDERIANGNTLSPPLSA